MGYTLGGLQDLTVKEACATMERLILSKVRAVSIVQFLLNDDFQD